MTAFKKGFLWVPRATRNKGPETLYSINAAGLTNIDLREGINDEAWRYEIEIINLGPTSNNSNLSLRGSQDGGGNFLAGTNYVHVRESNNTAAVGTINGNGGTGQAEFIIAQSVGNSLVQSFNGVIEVYRTPGVRTYMNWRGSWLTGGSDVVQVTGGGIIAVAGDINAWRLFQSAGGYSNGLVTLRRWPV